MSFESAAKGFSILEKEEGDLFIVMGIPDMHCELGDSVFIQFRSDRNQEVYEAVKKLKETIERAKSSRDGKLPWNI